MATRSFEPYCITEEGRGFFCSREKREEVKRGHVEMRPGFGKHWNCGSDDEAVMMEWKKLARRRLDGKAELDRQRELRFEEDMKAFWRLKG